MSRTLIAALLLTALATVAEAQTGPCPTSMAPVVNPSGWMCITPDPADYAATYDPGTGAAPVIARIDVLLFGPTVTDTATGTPTQTINIGKPPINAQGAVWVQRPEITAIPLGQIYKARAVTVGQPLTAGGPAQVSARSPESNPFSRRAPAPAPRAPLGISVPQ